MILIYMVEMKTEYIRDRPMSNIIMTISSNNKRKHEDDATSSKRQRRVPDIIAFSDISLGVRSALVSLDDFFCLGLLIFKIVFGDWQLSYSGPCSLI